MNCVLCSATVQTSASFLKRTNPIGEEGIWACATECWPVVMTQKAAAKCPRVECGMYCHRPRTCDLLKEVCEAARKRVAHN